MVARVVVRDVFETNAYFIIDDATGSGFLIDPGAEAERLYGISRDRGWRIDSRTGISTIRRRRNH